MRDSQAPRACGYKYMALGGGGGIGNGVIFTDHRNPYSTRVKGDYRTLLSSEYGSTSPAILFPECLDHVSILKNEGITVSDRCIEAMTEWVNAGKFFS